MGCRSDGKTIPVNVHKPEKPVGDGFFLARQPHRALRQVDPRLTLWSPAQSRPWKVEWVGGPAHVAHCAGPRSRTARSRPRLVVTHSSPTVRRPSEADVRGDDGSGCVQRPRSRSAPSGHVLQKWRASGVVTARRNIKAGPRGQARTTPGPGRSGKDWSRNSDQAGLGDAARPGSSA